MNLKFNLLVLALAALPGAAEAQFTDAFVTINPAWVTNRYAPDGFESAVYLDDSRLRLTIGPLGSTASRPQTFNTAFYNIQGRERPGGISGRWTLSAQVFVSSDFNTKTGALVRTALWAHTGTTDGGGDYAILGFTNASPTEPFNPAAADRTFRFQIFDGEFGDYIKLDLPADFVFDKWHTLAETSTGTTFEYRIDGVLVYTAATAAGNDLMSVMVQGYNFGEAAGYSVYWDNVIAAATRVAGDFNADAKSDILWSNSVNGDHYVWMMNGGSFTSDAFLGTVSPQWSLATGDFNADGEADLVWTNTGNGDRYIWLMNGTNFGSSVFIGTVSPEWLVTTGDFDGDGQSDLLWSNSVTGDRYVWLMNGTNVSSSVFLGTVGIQWTVATGDFNGDGQTDLLWSNTVNGDRNIWLMNGTTFSSSVFVGTVSPQWTVATGDFNGDGQADLLWSDSVTGDRYVWLMHGTAVGSSVFIGTISTQWQVSN